MSNHTFYWGGSIAAHQCEGAYDADGKGTGIMDLVISGSAEKPREFHDAFQEGAHYPSHHGIDFYHTYREDIKLFAEAGFTALRISVDWSRIYPNGDDEKPNQAGLDYYRKVITELRANGIEPFVTLFHFELPMNLVKKYGSWENRKVVDFYLRYCKTVFEEYRDLVKYWVTFNEMNHLDSDMVLSDFFTYMNTGLCYSKLPNPRETMARCAYHMTLASCMAINLGHRISPDFQIGCVFGLTPSYPYTCDPADSVAALHDMDNDMYQIDAMCRGEFPRFKLREYAKRGIQIEVTSEDRREFADSRLDFIGVNYYSSTVSAGNPGEGMEIDFFGRLNNPHLPKSDWGWTMDPVGMRYILTYLDRKYHLPLIVTENGIGAVDRLEEDGSVHDDYRIAYLKGHLDEMGKAIREDCVNCFGYLMWGPIDLISATTGEMKKRYGFIYVDQDDFGKGSRKRYKKDSFYWFQKYVREFETEEESE